MPIAFANPRRSYTHAFERYALDLSRHMTIQDVAQQDDEEQATAFLLDWLARAETSEVPMLVSLAKTLRKHALGLLAYDDYPISTGPMEGTNKIKTTQRQADGYRDQEFFKLKILACHEAKYALVG